MKLFKLLFIVIGATAFGAGLYGILILAACAWAMLHYAEGVYAKQDVKPDNAAPVQAPTCDSACGQGCGHCKSKQ